MGAGSVLERIMRIDFPLRQDTIFHLQSELRVNFIPRFSDLAPLTGTVRT